MKSAPSRNDEYLLYQTLLGSFPCRDLDDNCLAEYRTRIEHYMLKAAREAKCRTSWHNMHEKYETALVEFVRALLTRSVGNLFLDDLAQQVRYFAWHGGLNSLAMTLLKLTSPGVPDIFQGNETLDYSLVDPDNRRPIDYDCRQEQLAALRSLARTSTERLPALVTSLASNHLDGRAKTWIVLRVLDLRRRDPDLFAYGDYVPVKVTGKREKQVVAYVRRYRNRGLVVASGRLYASLGLEADTPPLGTNVWDDTQYGPRHVACRHRTDRCFG